MLPFQLSYLLIDFVKFRSDGETEITVVLFSLPAVTSSLELTKDFTAFPSRFVKEGVNCERRAAEPK